MSSLPKEDQESLRLLVQHVARAFYEPRYTIVLDQLVRIWVVERASDTLQSNITIRLILNGDKDIVPLAIYDLCIVSSVKCEAEVRM